MAKIYFVALAVGRLENVASCLVHLLGQISDDLIDRSTLHLYSLADGTLILVPLLLCGDSVVADDRVGQHQDLGLVRRIRQGLGVAHHARLKDCRDVNY